MEPYEILLDGDIGWEINLDSVKEHLENANGKDLKIKVSSSGGAVSVASTIRNTIASYMKDNDANVEFEIIGWAQSAASYLTTIKGASVVVYADTLYMYHNPWTWASGDHNDLLKESKLLKSLTDTYARGYVSKSGKSEEEILTQMTDTTILVGQEIIDNGFADSIIDFDADDDEPEMSSRDNVVKMSKEKYQSTHYRLVAAANGSKPEHLENLRNKNEQPTAPENKDFEMSKTKEEKENPVVVEDNDRAVACMKAQAAMPDQHAVLTKQFEAGMSADHFNGMVAHVDMVAASKKEEEAKDEVVVPIVPKEPDTETVMKKTAGRSGQTVEVK